VNSVISPNMQLIVPTVGQEAGPTYALDINSSLSLIDQHDHSPGKGVQITPAGIDINTTLAFNNNSASNLSLVSFVAGSSPASTIQALSVAPASSINELWYTDSNGTQTQITKNGTVNVIASSIPGESYSGGTFIWTQTQSSLPTTPANFDIGSITLRPNTAGTTNGITLTPPGSISSAYTITLPSLPVTNPAFLTISTAGVVSATPSTVGGITASNIANGTITTTQISPSADISGSQLSASAGIIPSQLDSISSGNWVYFSGSSGSFSGTFTSKTAVTSLNVTPTVFTNTRPMFISFNTGSLTVTTGSGTSTATYTLEAGNGSSNIILNTYTQQIDVTGANNLVLPASVLNFIWTNTIDLSSFPTITLYVTTSSTTTVDVTNVVMQTVQV
jgi:hypothetical protein